MLSALEKKREQDFKIKATSSTKGEIEFAKEIEQKVNKSSADMSIMNRINKDNIRNTNDLLDDAYAYMKDNNYDRDFQKLTEKLKDQTKMYEWADNANKISVGETLAKVKTIIENNPTKRLKQFGLNMGHFMKQMAYWGGFATEMLKNIFGIVGMGFQIWLDKHPREEINENDSLLEKGRKLLTNNVRKYGILLGNIFGGDFPIEKDDDGEKIDKDNKEKEEEEEETTENTKIITPITDEIVDDAKLALNTYNNVENKSELDKGALLNKIVELKTILQDNENSNKIKTKAITRNNYPKDWDNSYKNYVANYLKDHRVGNILDLNFIDWINLGLLNEKLEPNDKFRQYLALEQNRAIDINQIFRIKRLKYYLDKLMFSMLYDSTHGDFQKELLNNEDNKVGMIKSMSENGLKVELEIENFVEYDKIPNLLKTVNSNELNNDKVMQTILTTLETTSKNENQFIKDLTNETKGNVIYQEFDIDNSRDIDVTAKKDETSIETNASNNIEENNTSTSVNKNSSNNVPKIPIESNPVPNKIEVTNETDHVDDITYVENTVENNYVSTEAANKASDFDSTNDIASGKV